MKAKLVNLTPHTIHFFNDEGLNFVVPSSGIARVGVTRRTVTQLDLEGGLKVDLNEKSFGEVSGLPDPEEGVLYIVSALTAQAVPERTDVFVTDDTVRDDEGRIIGCRGIARI